MIDQRPSYTPPPVALMGQEQRPSYTPLPQVITAGPAMQGMPRVIGPVIDPGLMATTGKVQHQQLAGQITQQSPSYVPPPVTIMQNSHSYVPPVQMQGMQTTVQYDGTIIGSSTAQLPAQGPSITTLPTQQQPQQMMGMGPPQMGMPPQGPGGMMPGSMPPPMQMGSTGLPPIGLQPLSLPPMGFAGNQMGQPMGPGNMSPTNQLGSSPSFMQPGMMGGMQPGLGMMGNMPGQSMMGGMGQMPGPGQMQGQMPPMGGQMPYGQIGMGCPGSCPGGIPYPSMMPGLDAGGMNCPMQPGISHGPDGMPLDQGMPMTGMMPQMSQMPMMGIPQ